MNGREEGEKTGRRENGKTPARVSGKITSISADTQ